jgi:hypothetical protein
LIEENAADRPSVVFLATSKTCIAGSHPGLTREERSCADPELRKGFETLPISASDGIFLAALDSQAIFSRREGPDLFHKRSVHEHRSVDADESMGFEHFCHDRNRLT